MLCYFDLKCMLDLPVTLSSTHVHPANLPVHPRTPKAEVKRMGGELACTSEAEQMRGAPEQKGTPSLRHL